MASLGRSRLRRAGRPAAPRVSFAATDKQIPHVNVAGYVHVRGVDAKARTLTLFVPCAGQLPSKFLVMGCGWRRKGGRVG
jgi:hypothetical protein